MAGRMSAWSTKRSLVLYFLLAYGLSWAVEIPIALSKQGIINIEIPLAAHYLASLGPLLGALIVGIVSEGFAGVRSLLSGLTKWRVGRDYALFAILAPPLLFAVAVIVSRIIQGVWPDLRLLGQVDYLPYLGILPALILWLLTFGFAEEVGWRGFALPRLQAQYSAYAASLILGGLWALWHAPAFFYRDTYMAMGFLVFPMVLVSVLAASVVHTWLYNGTRGSLLMVVLFHGLFDFFSVSSAGGASGAIVMSAAIVFWAVRVIQLYGPATLAPVDKPVVHVPAAPPLETPGSMTSASIAH